MSLLLLPCPASCDQGLKVVVVFVVFFLVVGIFIVVTFVVVVFVVVFLALPVVTKD